METFLEKNQFPKSTEEIESLNNIISIKKHKSGIKTVPERISQTHMTSTLSSSKYSRR